MVRTWDIKRALTSARSTLPFVLGDQHATDRPLWILPVVLIGSMSAGCAISAVLSLPIARWFSRQNESASI